MLLTPEDAIFKMYLVLFKSMLAHCFVTGDWIYLISVFAVYSGKQFLQPIFL